MRSSKISSSSNKPQPRIDCASLTPRAVSAASSTGSNIVPMPTDGGHCRTLRLGDAANTSPLTDQQPLIEYKDAGAPGTNSFTIRHTHSGKPKKTALRLAGVGEGAGA